MTASTCWYKRAPVKSLKRIRFSELVGWPATEAGSPMSSSTTESLSCSACYTAAKPSALTPECSLCS